MLQHFGQLVFILIALASIGDYLRDTLEVPNRFLDSLVRASILQYTYLDCRHWTVHQMKHPLLVRSMCCMHLYLQIFLSLSPCQCQMAPIVAWSELVQGFTSLVLLYCICTHLYRPILTTHCKIGPACFNATNVWLCMIPLQTYLSVCLRILYDKDLK